MPNAPSNVSVSQFRAALDRHGGPAKQCRFAVRIQLTQGNQLLGRYAKELEDLIILCEAAELPGRGVDFVDARYYGPNIQMPFNAKYSQQIDLTFICRNESIERRLFDDWMEVINPSSYFDFNYLSAYQAEVQIFQFADYSDGSPSSKYEPRQAGKNAVSTYQWTLLRAYPLMVHPQPVTWAEQDLLRLSVSFSYRYWMRPGIDAAPTTRSLNINSGAGPTGWLPSLF